MFSSTELISFVFANETDLYYGDDLIKRDLNQYLWDRLHMNYDAVYFLSAEENGFAIRTYGDLRCREYVPGRKRIFGILSGNSAQADFGNWLLRQLRSKAGETAAFVCPLEDFCTVLANGQWDDILAEIAGAKNRTGIFVLTASATAEQTTKLLLESPVFEKLQEFAVTDLRCGAMRELYSSLKKRKSDNCVFLNTFSWERLRAMLLHLVMENPDRCESCTKLDLLTEYLYEYCRNPEFADGEGIFHREMPMNYLLYSNLYDQLSAERTWKKFEASSERYQKQGCFCKTASDAETRAPILRDSNSYAGRCMKIKLPGWMEEKEPAAEQAAGLLQKICDAVSAPMNRVENPEIASAAESFLNQLEAVYDSDSDTYIQVLSALKFCVLKIYTELKEETAQIMEVIQKYRDSISVSQQYFVLERELMLSRARLTEGELLGAALQQLKVQLYTLEKVKKRYLDLVGAMELGLKVPVSEGSIKGMLEELEKEIQHLDRFTNPSESVPVPEEEAEEEPEEEQEEFLAAPWMYDYRPPVF